MLEPGLEQLSDRVGVKANELGSLTAFVNQINDEKLSIALFETVKQRINDEMTKITLRNEELTNQQTSIENWVEKYLPLKLQH